MTDQHIQTTENGPFLAHGVTIRGADYVYAEDGAPMTWSFGDAFDVDGDTAALCRCGHSSNKPFCDGSHAGAEWDPSDAEQPSEGYEQRARRKESPTEGYAMLDDTKLCMHAGLCATSKQSVWQMMPSTDDAEVRGQVIRMVEKCPSGRLSNVIDGSVAEPALPAEVNVIPGGPLWVTGGITVTNASGEPIETRNRVTLCRCGASESKPLCDGSHKDIGFEGIS
jgi:CDGSH-type Zn-finger protein